MIGEVTYPCVLKPVSAHQWRQGNNWQIVGSRKAIGISSRKGTARGIPGDSEGQSKGATPEYDSRGRRVFGDCGMLAGFQLLLGGGI